MSVFKYYSFNEILNWLNYGWEFSKKNRVFPFTRDPMSTRFSWGQILIPRDGIREVVLNKIKDDGHSRIENPINKINMMYQVPFITIDKQGETSTGIINHDISLSFRYDKQFKYGDINKSIYEVCFFILENATRSNGYYILGVDYIQEFFSNFVINNQWGIGAMTISTAPEACFKPIEKDKNENEESDEKCCDE